MSKVIGVRREDKNEWERRVPLIPSDLAELQAAGVARFVVQSSPIRVFSDDDSQVNDMDDGELTKTGKIRRKFVQETYRDIYEALYDGQVSEKAVEAFYQYQDGQTTTVETTIKFYTMEK